MSVSAYDRVMLSLPKDLLREVDDYCDTNDRSRSGFIRQAVRRALNDIPSPDAASNPASVTAAPPGNLLELCRGTGAESPDQIADRIGRDDLAACVAAPVLYPNAAVPHVAAGAAGTGVTGTGPAANPVAEQQALHAAHLRRHLDAKAEQAEQQRQAKEAVIQQLSQQGE
jgi:hypothetical protein